MRIRTITIIIKEAIILKKIFICTSILSLGIIIFGCDETSTPASILDDEPAITRIHVQPQVVQFLAEEDGSKSDTTLTIGIFISTVNTPDEQPPVYIVSDKDSGEEIHSGIFDITDSRTGNFGVDVPIETTTDSFEDFIINAYPSSDGGNGNYAQTSFKIIGIPNNPPQILETDNPDEITRPSSGNTPATFIAKVTDPDGQDTIDKVYIRIINVESGEVQGSPFEMFDDGITYDDAVENDSTYTWSLPVTPTDNNPNRSFDIEYFAIDEGGLVSDTVTSTFIIRE